MRQIKFFLFFVLVLPGIALTASPASGDIRLNQLGFYPHAKKIAVVVNDSIATDFYIVSLNKRDTVFHSRLGNPMQSTNSSLKTKIADFSAFQESGDYELMVPGAGYSYPFKIMNKVNYTVGVASLKGFYYMRVSMPLEEKYAGKWARAAGHPDTAVIIHPSAATNERPAGTIISTPGGWYDAGDYNKYIVNAGISTATLLAAYEDFPFYFDTLKTNIPEHGNGVPDLLSEILYNLRWMLSMQDPNDGGVYNKCTNAAFDPMVMPGVTKLPRYVVQKGTAATLDFAAVAAQASRIFSRYKKQFPGLSDSCLHAAVYAWQWAEKNPSLEYDQGKMNKSFEPKITTGGYGDRNFTDEWFWAATELFTTTKNETYNKIISARIQDTASLPSWGNVYLLGYYTLLRMQKSSKGYAGETELLKQKLIKLADSYLQHIDENAFQTVMGHSRKDFNWGSNSNAANQGILLINAYFLTKNKKYIDYALTNLDYILGRNATGYSFVTGIGTKSTMHPHHRPSVADGIEDPVPGLMAGGPNPGMQDHCHYDFTEPETAYSDTDCSYASNEITINWNAPLVYLSNAIEALQYDINYSSKK